MRSGAAHPRFLRQPRDLIFRLLKSLTAADFRVRGREGFRAGIRTIGAGRLKEMYRFIEDGTTAQEMRVYS